MNCLMLKSFVILSLITLASCLIPQDEIAQESIVASGLKPIYASNEEWKSIDALPPRPVSKLGKIYYKKPYIFVNELYEGIHIIDNSNPSDPIFLKFLKIVGNKDIAIKGNYLYADNVTDLLVFNIEDLDDITLVNTIEGLYNEQNLIFPDAYEGFFECVDSSKGIVIGWEETELTDPKCWR